MNKEEQRNISKAVEGFCRYMKAIYEAKDSCGGDRDIFKNKVKESALEFSDEEIDYIFDSFFGSDQEFMERFHKNIESFTDDDAKRVSKILMEP